MLHKFVVFNRQTIPAEDAFLPAVSSAAFYGRGIFTTVAIYNSKPFLWEKHWRRLNENAVKIGIDLSDFDAQTVEKSISEIIEKNNLADARARITFFDETPNKIWRVEPRRRTNFLVVTADFRAVVEELRLTISPYRVNSTSPLADVKSCNYLENILALEDARARGFDEALRLNERREVVSATTANVFWVKNGEMFTPHLATGCLNGTTRSFVLENFTVKETQADLAELSEPDEIFLTSAGIGIAKVASLGEKTFVHRITNRVEEKFLLHSRL